jgi:glycosyltransferase involved in cell wall biosynthesis
MYDYVFVTHLPSFYKVNLYHELAKHLKIKVVFIGQGSSIRTKDFTPLEMKFDHVFLSDGAFEERNVFSTLFRLASFIFKTKYKKMVLGGWDLPEFWLALLLNRITQNTLALESTENESATEGIKGLVKKFFLSRISTVFASGELHASLLKRLNYRDEVRITRGVGLINKPATKNQMKKYEKKFLYVGRLSPEKNLPFLIEVFKGLPDHQLLIVGTGPMKSELLGLAPSNVKFMDHVENSKIGEVFKNADFLILASTSEPWGLVVEEALYFGRPVLISKVCGASELIDSGNGYVFDPRSPESLSDILRSIDETNFNLLQENIAKNKLEKKDFWQVVTYRDVITLA